MLNQLRDSLSKIAVERDNFNCLLHNKMMKFKVRGELSLISLDSLEQILIQKQIKEIEKRYFLEDDDTGLPIPIYFEFREGKILSNGDFFLCGEIRYSNEDSHDLVLAVFDSNKDFKLKKIKQLSVDYESMATSTDKICLTYLIKDMSTRYLAREETENDKEYEETNDEDRDFVGLILNENLEKLHRYKSHAMRLIGANDSFLFFMNDSEHKNGEVSFYTWSMEFVRTIGQSRYPNLPFYIPHSDNSNPVKFVNKFGRYYYLSDKFGLRIFDEETGILLKSISCSFEFGFNNNYNIILSHSGLIKYLSFTGDLIKIKIKTRSSLDFEEDFTHICFPLNYDKRFFAYSRKYERLFFLSKYDEKTHEVV